MDVGLELREARQRAGLTREEIARRTKIKLYKLEALEQNDFEHLPEGIYLNGIVRAYAQEVGIDAEPLLAHLHAVAAPPDDGWEFDSEAVERFPEEHATAGGRPAAVQSIRRSFDDLDLYDRARADDSGPAGTLEPRPPAAAQPQRRGWASRLALPFVAMVAAVGWGAYVYEKSRPVATADEIAIPAVQPRSDATPASGQPAAPGSTAANKAVEPDSPGSQAPPGESAASGSPPSDRAPAESVVRRPDAREPAASVRDRDRPIAETTAPETAAPAQVPSAEPERAAPTPEAPALDQNDRAEAESSPERLAASDLTGAWRLATQLESTSSRGFSGLRFGYELRLQQDGDHISGEGRKVSENGEPLAPTRQTPLSVSGIREGGTLTLTFIERGTERTSDGTFALRMDDDGVLRGRFASSVARAAGTAEARRTAR